MTQAKVPGGSGSEQINSTTQYPEDITWPSVASVRNRVLDQVVTYEKDVDASADFDWRFTAEDNGKIVALRYTNGAVAADGTNGWELAFVNLSDSSASVAYFGVGSGTEAAKATDKATVAANDSVEIVSTVDYNFNKGDTIQLTADRDGTTIVGAFQLVVSYEATGR